MIKKPHVIKNKDGEYLKTYDSGWAYFEDLRKAEVFINDKDAWAQIKRMKDKYTFWYGHDEVKIMDKMTEMNTLKVVPIIMMEE